MLMLIANVNVFNSGSVKAFGYRPLDGQRPEFGGRTSEASNERLADANIWLAG
jgi:hypothetical protein